jgi:hypothetical protein
MSLPSASMEGFECVPQNKKKGKNVIEINPILLISDGN